jgi:hypothetical protein
MYYRKKLTDDVKEEIRSYVRPISDMTGRACNNVSAILYDWHEAGHDMAAMLEISRVMGRSMKAVFAIVGAWHVQSALRAGFVPPEGIDWEARKGCYKPIAEMTGLKEFTVRSILGCWNEAAVYREDARVTIKRYRLNPKTAYRVIGAWYVHRDMRADDAIVAEAARIMGVCNE